MSAGWRAWLAAGLGSLIGPGMVILCGTALLALRHFKHQWS